MPAPSGKFPKSLEKQGNVLHERLELSNTGLMLQRNKTNTLNLQSEQNFKQAKQKWGGVIQKQSRKKSFICTSKWKQTANTQKIKTVQDHSLWQWCTTFLLLLFLSPSRFHSCLKPVHTF